MGKLQRHLNGLPRWIHNKFQSTWIPKKDVEQIVEAMRQNITDTINRHNEHRNRLPYENNERLIAHLEGRMRALQKLKQEWLDE
jgi:hypothetical protein